MMDGPTSPLASFVQPPRWKIARRVARPWSLALRLTVWYAATAFLLVAGVAWVQYRTLRSDLAGEDDQLLLETLAAARSGAIQAVPGAELSVRSALLGPVVRILDARCHTIRGPRLVQGPAPVCNSASGPAPMLRTWISPNGRMWRVATQEVAGPATQESRWIEVSLDRWTDVALLEGYRRELAMVLPAALLLSALLGFWIARRGLAPLDTLAGAVSRVDAQSLARRIEVTETANTAPAEVRALLTSFEMMRERLNAAFAALTQFSTELAHEFRTPLHILQQQAEVALTRSRTPDEYRDVLTSSLEELDRLHRMVDDILFLARTEDPRARIEPAHLAVGAELADVADYLEPLATERGVTLVSEAPEGLLIAADRMLLRRALVNLVTNAVRHTPDGGRVTLTAERHAEGTAVEVHDTGTGIPASALPRVFDRYFRVPGAPVERERSEAAEFTAGHTVGTGLGLAIVRGIMSLHGGSASVRSTPGRGTWVTLVFPTVLPDDPA